MTSFECIKPAVEIAKNVGQFALHIVFGKPDYHDYPISANITYHTGPTTLEDQDG